MHINIIQANTLNLDDLPNPDARIYAELRKIPPQKDNDRWTIEVTHYIHDKANDEDSTMLLHYQIDAGVNEPQVFGEDYT